MSVSDRPPLHQGVTFLYTHDLAAATHFYAELLGLALVLDQGSCRIYRLGRDAFVGLCRRAEVEIQPSSVILTLVVDQVDAVDQWYAYLIAQGVDVEKAPTLNPTYNIYHLFVRDPAGYLVEIQTFLDPAWPRS
jgi:catechol 2,3-dioxygenase-like lactoylglutathione lyase family enzyme